MTNSSAICGDQAAESWLVTPGFAGLPRSDDACSDSFFGLKGKSLQGFSQSFSPGPAGRSLSTESDFVIDEQTPACGRFTQRPGHGVLSRRGHHCPDLTMSLLLHLRPALVAERGAGRESRTSASGCGFFLSGRST